MQLVRAAGGGERTRLVARGREHFGEGEVEFGPGAVDDDAGLELASCEGEFAVDAVGVRAPQVTADIEGEIVHARADGIVAVVDAAQRACSRRDLLGAASLAGARVGLGESDRERSVLGRQVAGPGQVPDGAGRVARAEGESAQPGVGVGVGRHEPDRPLVLAGGFVEPSRPLQGFGVANVAGGVVGVDRQSGTVEREAVCCRALVDEGGKQVGPTEGRR